VERFAAEVEKRLSAQMHWVNKGERMLDLIFIATTVLFFLIAIAYVHACEKLR